MTRLLGRTVELDRLLAAIDSLPGRGARAIAVLGEPGIGKTSLIGEALARAGARNDLVCSARAAEFEQDLPFGIVLDALDPYLGSLDERRLRSLTDADRTQLASVFPSLRSRSAAAARPSHERFAYYQAVRALLSTLARERPIVAAFDDLQWADQASIELISYLLRRPPEGPVLLLLASRVAHGVRRLELALVAAQARGDCDVVELAPLSRSAAEPLLTSLDDASLRDAVYAEAGGNPFYVQQLVRSAESFGAAARGTEPFAGVPAAVRDALLIELEGQPAGLRAALDAAAVTGDPFPADVVAEVASLSSREVLDQIDEAIGAGLVRTTQVPGYFAFRHPIVRRTVYELTPAAWRIGAHQRAAVALAARGASVAARAHHIEQSATVGDEAAVALLEQAGRDASALAPASAARWFAAALRLLKETADPGQAVALRVALGTACAAAGRIEESSEQLAAVLAMLPPEQPVLRARVLTAMAVMDRILGRPGQVRAPLAETLRELQGPPTAEAAALSIELAADRYFDGAWEEMTAPAHEADQLARASGDPSLCASATAVLALAEVNSGRCTAALAHAGEAGELLDRLSDAELAVHLGAGHWVGWCAHHLERYGEVVRHYERALAIARRRGQSHLLVPTLIGLTISYVWLGELERAREQAETAVETAHLVGAEQMLAMTYALRAWVAVRGGGLHDALELAEAPVRAVLNSGSALHGPLAHAWLGEARIEAGAVARGRDEIVAAAGGDRLAGIEPCQRSYFCAVLTAAEIALGEPGRAAGWAALAAAAAEPYELAGPRMWALRAGGEVALANGQTERAVSLAREAVSTAGEAHPLERERCRAVLGLALAAGGELADGVAELRLAREAFLAAGAARLAEQAARELRRLGSSVPRQGRRGHAGGGVASLSGRELEVAELVCERLTNREIAERLVISEKTVERHMAHIFQKLGLGSRVAVARAVERGAV